MTTECLANYKTGSSQNITDLCVNYTENSAMHPQQTWRADSHTAASFINLPAYLSLSVCVCVCVYISVCGSLAVIVIIISSSNSSSL